jgi:hypothetical protein
MALASKYQIVLADDCDAYQIGEAFLANPNKASKNVDVVLGRGDSGRRLRHRTSRSRQLRAHAPTGRLEPAHQLDSESYGFQTMSRLHGIDNDPKLHPFANTSAFDKVHHQRSVWRARQPLRFDGHAREAMHGCVRR